MPTYQIADESVAQLAKSILLRFNSHTPLIDAGVVIDFIFAYPTTDDNGEPRGNAISKNGVKALGLCRIIGLKDRAMGRGDVEILIDHPWWEDAIDEKRAALLDHELHHAMVKTKNDVVMRDDLHRPLIKLRKHDVEIGWFDIVALRHGGFSQERLQAKKLYDQAGQLYWPDIAGPPDPQLAREASISPSEAKMADDLTAGQSVTITTGKTSVTIGPSERQFFRKAETELAETELDEELIQECVEIIRSEQQVSVSLLQRRLRLSYTRAYRIMDELEKRGIVGPAKGAEPRDILIDLEAKATD